MKDLQDSATDLCRGSVSSKMEHDFVLQWGENKRTRCDKAQGKSRMDVKIKRSVFRVEKVAYRADSEAPQSHAFFRALNSQPPTLKSMAAESVRVKSSVRRYYSEINVRDNTRRHHGSNHNKSSTTEETNKISMDADVKQKKSCNLKGFVWPKIVVALSSKDKEEDFMAIKGCKLPHRPKKRARFIQKNLLLVSPGSWLCDLSQERYEVQEKKNPRKRRRRGLKAMGNLETDSD